MRNRRILLVPAVALAAALLWSTAGTFSSASGQTPTATIRRAHEGARRPTFDKPIFILVMGGDARSGNPERTRMDSIHIVAIDPTSRPIRGSIVGIPRDLWVDVPGRGKDKITHAGFHGGARLMIDTVENLSGCTFDYWMQVSFEGIRGVRKGGRRVGGLINDIGGVHIDVPRALTEPNPVPVPKGDDVRLNGNKFLSFARNRHERARGDFDRTKAQGDLMIAALREARADVASNPGTALKLLGALRRHLRMNIGLTEGLELGLFTLRMRPRNVRNIDLAGRIGSAGDASVVLITSKGRRQLVDICGDGVLGG